jgi:hypothetical protein
MPGVSTADSAGAASLGSIALGPPHTDLQSLRVWSSVPPLMRALGCRAAGSASLSSS